jgi:hypothetical protein
MYPLPPQKESFRFCKTKAALKTNSKSRLCITPIKTNRKPIASLTVHTTLGSEGGRGFQHIKATLRCMHAFLLLLVLLLVPALLLLLTFLMLLASILMPGSLVIISLVI